jgi:hypothetical protein
MRELEGVLERQEEKIGVRHDDPNLTAKQKHALQPYWERAESARLERAAGYPHLNAMALISIYSALDALIEGLVAPFYEAALHHYVTESVRESMPHATQPARRAKVEETLTLPGTLAIVESLAKKVGRVGGAGTKRYEEHLKAVGLAAPEQREIPESLDDALREIGALRDVLIHRGGRIDTAALKKAPTLRYAEKDFVRIDRDAYVRYVAALRTFGQEVFDRLIIRMGGEAANELSRWEGNYPAGM